MNNTLSTDEMERFQQLSNEFEADVQVSLLSDITCWVVYADGQGPLVSTKQSTQAIATEYANADPTFATKSNVRVLILYYTRGGCVLMVLVSYPHASLVSYHEG